MTPDAIFSLVGLIAACGWLLLAVVPGRNRVVAIASIVIPAVLAAVYVAIVATQFAGSAGGFSSLSAVATLFQSPWLLLAGWIHYLAFDLLVGGWEVRDARSRRVSHLLVLPCLFLTFMFGPAGWLAYIVVRKSGRPGTA